jgi:hypothetical protein
MAWHPGVYRVLARRLAEIVMANNAETWVAMPFQSGK